MPSVVSYLTTQAYFPFAVALGLMLAILALELLGIGLTSAGEALGFDAHPDGELDIPGLHWLGVGRVPLGMLVMCWLFFFGLGGVGLQRFSELSASGALPLSAAVPSAIGFSLVSTSFVAGILSKILPQDETSAVSLDSLLSRRATMLDIAATASTPARAEVTDFHGQTHYVSVLPHDTPDLKPGELVLLVRREESQFWAVPINKSPF